jgi:hypothetical protein
LDRGGRSGLAGNAHNTVAIGDAGAISSANNANAADNAASPVAANVATGERNSAKSLLAAVEHVTAQPLFATTSDYIATDSVFPAACRPAGGQASVGNYASREERRASPGE